MFLKEIWCCSFHGRRNFGGESFLRGEHFTSASTKTAWTIDFNLCTHIFDRILNKNVSAFFLTMSHSFFYFNNSASFESIIHMKTVKSRLFKKYLKRRKSRARFCLRLGWPRVSAKDYWKLQFCWCRSS